MDDRRKSYAICQQLAYVDSKTTFTRKEKKKVLRGRVAKSKYMYWKAEILKLF